MGRLIAIDGNFYVITISRLFRRANYPATDTVRIMICGRVWLQKVEIKYSNRQWGRAAVMHIFSEGEGIQWKADETEHCAIAVPGFVFFKLLHFGMGRVIRNMIVSNKSIGDKKYVRYFEC